MRMNIFTSLLVSLLACAMAVAQFKSNVTLRNESFGSDVIPDPSNKLSLATLLAHSSVLTALELSDEQIRIVSDALKANSGSFSTPIHTRDDGKFPTKDEIRAIKERHQARSSQLLDEVLTPNQWKRLREIAYQVEISRLGLGIAIAHGRLGRDIGVTENQVTNLQEKASKIQRKAEQEILKILIAAQKELLAELSPEQRDKANECLGMPFVFRDELGRGPKSP